MRKLKCLEQPYVAPQCVSAMQIHLAHTKNIYLFCQTRRLHLTFDSSGMVCWSQYSACTVHVQDDLQTMVTVGTADNSSDLPTVMSPAVNVIIYASVYAPVYTCDNLAL